MKPGLPRLRPHPLRHTEVLTMSDKMTEDKVNALLERAGVDPIEDVDTGNLLDVIIDLQTRIDDALQNIDSVKEDLKKIRN